MQFIKEIHTFPDGRKETWYTLEAWQGNVSTLGGWEPVVALTEQGVRDAVAKYWAGDTKIIQLEPTQIGFTVRTDGISVIWWQYRWAPANERRGVYATGPFRGIETYEDALEAALLVAKENAKTWLFETPTSIFHDSNK